MHTGSNPDVIIKWGGGGGGGGGGLNLTSGQDQYMGRWRLMENKYGGGRSNSVIYFSVELKHFENQLRNLHFYKYFCVRYTC